MDVRIVLPTFGAMFLFAIAVYALNNTQVPYTATETYVENVPLNFISMGSIQTVDDPGFLNLFPTRKVSWSIMNNDTIGGSASAYFFYTDGKDTLSKIVKANLNPGEIKTLYTDIPTNTNATEAKLWVDTIPVEKTRTVTTQVSLWDYFLKGLNAGR